RYWSFFHTSEESRADTPATFAKLWSPSPPSMTALLIFCMTCMFIYKRYFVNLCYITALVFTTRADYLFILLYTQEQYFSSSNSLRLYFHHLYGIVVEGLPCSYDFRTFPAKDRLFMPYDLTIAHLINFFCFHNYTVYLFRLRFSLISFTDS